MVVLVVVMVMMVLVMSVGGDGLGGSGWSATAVRYAIHGAAVEHGGVCLVCAACARLVLVSAHRLTLIWCSIRFFGFRSFAISDSQKM